MQPDIDDAVFCAIIKIWNRKFILLFITNLLVLAAFYASIPTLFQSFVTGTTPAPKRGVANATYMLSYDIGIGIGSLLMGCLQETIGLSAGFGWTAIAYVIGGIVYICYVDRYYQTLKNSSDYV